MPTGSPPEQRRTEGTIAGSLTSHGDESTGERPRDPPNRRDIDGTTRRILDELQRDGRVSLAELGRRVGLSPPAVAERVSRLERDGVITGYHARIDPRALGFALGVVIRVRPAPREIAKVAELARETPEVVECHRITGEDCFFMKAHVRDVEHLEEVIDRFVVFGQTTTLDHAVVAGARPRDRRLMPVLAAGEGGDVGYQLIQVAGSLLILAGFAAAQAGRLSIDSRRYLVLNFVGSAILAVLAWIDRQWGFLLLEGVWALVSLYSLVQLVRGRPPTAPGH